MRHRLPQILILAMTAFLLAGCGSSADGTAELKDSAAGSESIPALEALPGLAELNRLSAPVRQPSATNFEMLSAAPVLSSGGASSVFATNSLALDSQQVAGGPGLAWAVFALSGLPTDGSNVPTQLSITKNGQGWLAIGNFATGRWEFTLLFKNGSKATPNGADYVSPTGSVFAAVLAYPYGLNPAGQISCSSLMLDMSADLPTGPTAKLNLLTANPVSGTPLSFDAQGSVQGDGIFSLFSYDFGDGSPVETSTDPATPMQHTYAASGNYTVTLTVDADVAGNTMSDTDSIDFFADEPGAPVAVLNIIGSRHALEYPVTMDAVGTDQGLGIYTSIVYDFGDGNTYSLSDPFDPSEVVQHTYLSTGTFTVTLTVETDQGGTPRQDVVSQDVEVGDTFKELLVVYNSDIPESADLASYYMTPETGRAIDPAYKLGLPLGMTWNSTIARPDYNTDIRDPIIAFLDAQSLGFRNNLKYILLMRGVPYQLSDGGSGLTALYASVDSELCTLYSDASVAPYEKAGWLANSPAALNFQESVPRAFYLAGNVPFVHGSFDVAYDPTWDDTQTNDQIVYPLDYLVGRLDAYTYDTAKAMVDRSLNADTSGNGWVVFDSSEGTYGQGSDTMVDPVWPYTQDRPSGYDLMVAAGFECFADVTTERIILGSDALPLNFQNSLIAYAGWGVNHNGGSWPNGTSYILKDLGWNYLPGACFFSYESFNGSVFSCSDPNDPSIGHPGQGMICDFFHMGGTCATGNVYEPYTIGCGDERWIYDRYLNKGDRWIEAAYKGLRLLSWQEVVVGDPLCRVKP